jgi:hypothetical protein
MVIFKPQLLYLQEKTPVPSEQEAGWAPKPVRCFGEQKNLLPLLRFKPQTIQPIA